MRNLSKSLTVFSFLVLSGATQEPGYGADSTPLQSLAEAETAFAKMAVEKGTRDAFLAYLADEAVIFEPGPANGKKTWEKRAPSENLLTWEPNFVAVSRSGDFGYTIGPWEFKKDPKHSEAKAFGQFLSIWKKQKDGAWKVVLDAGVETPKPTGKPSAAQNPVTPAPGQTKIEKIDLDAARKEVREVEHRFAKASTADTGAAIIAFASDDIRVLREGVLPAVGEDGAQLMLNSDHAKTTLQPAGGDISQAGDLAYEYGKYVTERGAGPERGHYVMIWKKNVRGTWRLSVDRRQRQLPAEKKLKE
jgi:ketosteroid isomerase-like protein